LRPIPQDAIQGFLDLHFIHLNFSDPFVVDFY